MAAKKQIATKTDNEFWDFVRETSNEVARWPEWMREGGRSATEGQAKGINCCTENNDRSGRTQKHSDKVQL